MNMVHQVSCPICHSQTTEERFRATVLKKHIASYHFCTHCEFLFVPQPTWLEEAYAQAINTTDTGILQRNLELSQATAILLYCCFPHDGRYLDFAGGYGLLTRLMRDIGFDFYWHDRYCENLFAQGFVGDLENARYDLATCFEVLEHLEEPIRELQTMLTVTDSVFFRTTQLPDPIPAPGIWHYYAPEHGQHIAFYRWRTFEVMAEKLGCRIYRFGHHLGLLTRRNLTPWRWQVAISGPRKLLLKRIKRCLKSRTAIDSHNLAAMIPETAPVTQD